KPQMIAEQLFEVLRILNSFEIKSDRISAECGLTTLIKQWPNLLSGHIRVKSWLFNSLCIYAELY
ncbi:hypothetical protein, partial [Microcoleus sp. PH2017_05_CCC_O_A]|uniref:hypothetical protein n=1 Tax=Microcoleus sp. PH2017_05_CCC_O_A TaxID=2798816 RepID=UPI0025FC20F4